MDIVEKKYKKTKYFRISKNKVDMEVYENTKIHYYLEYFWGIY